MAQPNDTFKLSKSFFHALSKVNTEITQYVFESLYKSAHTTRSSDIWAEDITYCLDETEADTWVASNPTIGHKYTLQPLTEIPGSNGQAWYIDDGGTFINSWIAPTDIPNLITKAPSYGFSSKLYRSDDTIIPPSTDVWMVNYYSGLVLFQQGYTPSSLGYGIPKITCYNYIGLKGDGSSGNIGTPIRLNSLNIDGTTNLINTDIELLASTNSYKDVILTICNQTASPINCMAAHIVGALASITPQDYLCGGTEILANETKAISIPYLNSGETIMVRSDSIDTTFKLTAIQTTTVEGSRLGSIDIDGVINPIDTNLVLHTFGSPYFGVSYLVCNRNSADVNVKVAHIDGGIGSLTIDDFEASEVESNSSKAYVLGQYYSLGDTFSFQSNTSETNIILYGCITPTIETNTVNITSTKLSSSSTSDNDGIYTGSGSLSTDTIVSMDTNNLQFDSLTQSGVLAINSTTNRVGMNTLPTEALDVVGNIQTDSSFIKEGNLVATIERVSQPDLSSTYIGMRSGESNSGYELTAIGYRAGRNNSANMVVSVGAYASQGNIGIAQTAVGHQAGGNNRADNQIVLGYRAGENCYPEGSNFIGIGILAGQRNRGVNTIVLGYEAGVNNIGDNVIALGYQAGNTNVADNQFIVRQQNINTTSLLQGNFSSGRLGVYNNDPQSTLHIDSNLANTSAITTIENNDGSYQTFLTTTTPETNITGSIGDQATDIINGKLYIKETGSNTNTGWVEFASGSSTASLTVPKNIVIVDDSVPEIQGQRYTSWANADAFLNNSGSITSSISGSCTIPDDGKADDHWIGGTIFITTGGSAGNSYPITDSTSTVITATGFPIGEGGNNFRCNKAAVGNVWAIKFSGVSSEAITVRANNYIVGEGRDITTLTGALTSEAVGYIDGVIQNVNIANLSLTGSGTLFCEKCLLSGGTPTGGGMLLIRGCLLTGGNYDNLGAVNIASSTIFGGTYTDIDISNTYIIDFFPLVINSINARSSSVDFMMGNTTMGNGDFELHDCYFRPNQASFTVTEGEWNLTNVTLDYSNTITLNTTSDTHNFSNVIPANGEDEITIIYNDSGNTLSYHNIDPLITIEGTGDIENRDLTSDYWVLKAASENAIWDGIIYGGDMFVACSNDGATGRIATSIDGETWTSIVTPTDGEHRSIAYGNNTFVAVGQNNGGTPENSVLTSSDGKEWTLRTAASSNHFYDVCFGNGLFVAVSDNGSLNRAMYSVDGITWVSAVTLDEAWFGVTYGDRFVAVSGANGNTNRVMTSDDGITWTVRSAVDNGWYKIEYGNGVYMAIASSGTSSGNIMISEDSGVTWTYPIYPAVSDLRDITYQDGVFTIIASLYSLFSEDNGVTWTRTTMPSGVNWLSVVAGNGITVALASGGTTGYATKIGTAKKSQHSKEEVRYKKPNMARRDALYIDGSPYPYNTETVLIQSQPNGCQNIKLHIVNRGVVTALVTVSYVDSTLVTNWAMEDLLYAEYPITPDSTATVLIPGVSSAHLISVKTDVDCSFLATSQEGVDNGYRLAAFDTSGAGNVALYKAESNVSKGSLYIYNHGTSSAIYHVMLIDGDLVDLADEDYIRYELAVGVNETVVISLDLDMVKGHTLAVFCTESDVNFSFFGKEH